MMSHLIFQLKPFVRWRNDTVFTAWIAKKVISVLSECYMSILFFIAFPYHPAVILPNIKKLCRKKFDFLFFQQLMVIYLCPLRVCLWECVTSAIRFYRGERASIYTQWIFSVVFNVGTIQLRCLYSLYQFISIKVSFNIALQQATNVDGAAYVSVKSTSLYETC